ncbi:MAG: trimeric intracellular cation channel family protein [Oscillospiraceae bacterium]
MEITEQIFYILELIGTLAFAVSGAMIAIERRLDLFGVVFLGVITACGGGMIRDILIGAFPPAMFLNKEYVLIACLVSIIVFFIAYFARRTYFSKVKRIDFVNNIFDAVGLGAFAVTGTRIGIASGFGDNAFMCIFLGLLTGIGGGLLRDMMSRSVPLVLRKRIYAVAAIVGGGLYYLLYLLELGNEIAIFAGVGVTCAIRILATIFRWDLPVAVPLPETVEGEFSDKK